MKFIKKQKSSSSNFRRKKGNNRRAPSTLNPELLVRKATAHKEEARTPAWNYEATELHPLLKRNLSKRGYTHPTPIQEQCLQPATQGRDILGIAGTGTGKTAAFLIPIVQQLLENPKTTRALIIIPTRELALQVTEEFDMVAAQLNFRASCFIGGRSISSDLARLKQPNHVVIATPGRLLDLNNQRALSLGQFNTLVLDEFDRMLDMGFLQDVKKILKGLTSRKQTMFFSATMDKKQRALINDILTNPVEIMIEQRIAASDRVDQELIKVQPGRNKFDMLLQLIQNNDFSRVMIFAETKRVVNQVSKKLGQSGVRSDVIHGNKSQSYRQNALKMFSSGKVQVLVATDVAARGLDVSDVSHVINYQMPQTMDSYIHRIGRTGRAGKHGRAFTFVD
ncbi:DEAD/DEAH box helicase [Marinoscillum sp. MHG1-6]|uniref:DEAD/DEAH box helicase n=1 Tax=Marinoscillum sp. MHG1-6 TaxID=2959627 RepID=UPI002158029C|nr:DEAD/DEAH box helicase [Marinoscillum sp. MHG1-6]